MNNLPKLSPAAGWLKTPDNVAKLSSLELEEITIGSIALEQRHGNTGATDYWSDSIVINSMGIPTQGFAWFCDNFKLFVEAAATSTLRISIVPFSKGDLKHMVRRLCSLAKEFQVNIIIEINLGCPNVWGANGQKTIISYDDRLVHEALIEVAEGRGRDKIFIAVKFSPMFDPVLIIALVGLCVKFDIDEIVTVNTVPNTTLFDTKTGKPFINAKPYGSDTIINLGGQSGPSILPIAVGNVLMFKRAIIEMKARILLKGVGGITDGWSLRQHELAGADSFAVGQHCMRYGAKVFPEIVDDYLTRFG